MNSTNTLSALLVDLPLRSGSENFKTTIYWNEIRDESKQ